MQTKTKVIFVSISLLTAFASGRWLAPEKVKTEVKTIYVEKKAEKTNENSHKETIIVEKPDGTKETKIIEDDHKKTTTTDTTEAATGRTKEVTRSAAKITLSAMAGLRLRDGGTPVFGGLVSKPILGPITVGLWGLSDGTAGASAGLTF